MRSTHPLRAGRTGTEIGMYFGTDTNNGTFTVAGIQTTQPNGKVAVRIGDGSQYASGGTVMLTKVDAKDTATFADVQWSGGRTGSGSMTCP